MPGQPAPSRGESLWAHAEGSISEDVILAGARERATDIGAGAVTPAVGALLCLLAKLSGGKAVAEVGTGAGVSGLWLLSGMRDDGVLTTIDIEPEHLRLARQAFCRGGHRAVAYQADQRPRPRGADPARRRILRPGIHRRRPDRPARLRRRGVRLLRSGGVIVVHRAALGGRAGDPGARDAEVIAVREAARLIAEDERLTPALVPLGDGVLAAVRD